MNKKIFIEIPTWLGDAVMTTPAIENIIKQYPNCEITIFGSYVSTELFKYHPNVKDIIIDTSKKEGNRYLNLRKLAKSTGKVDIAFSFRRNFTTKLLLWFIDSKVKFTYKRDKKTQKHQVVRYNDFVNKSLFLNTNALDLVVHLNNDKTTLSSSINTFNNELPILGINPGATYGSAKRWYPEEFAKVAIKLSSQYNIVLFGSANEEQMSNEIEELIKKEDITNYTNLAGKTSVEELINGIASLDLFITNDSGPMHLAAAFKVPTVCIFGPTKYKETSQWNNSQSMIVKKDYKCMPCMKRECPLTSEVENHQCMKNIKAQDVLDTIYANIEAKNIKKKQLKKDFLVKNDLSDDTQLILFTANNFKQNGIFEFLDIIADISANNFKAIVSGCDSQLNIAKQRIDELKIADKIILVNNFAIKTCDIFILPTKNKKFALNILRAMKYKCVVFAPKQNEATIKLLDIFATMESPNNNISNKIDALLNNTGFLKTVQKENKKIVQEIYN